MSAVKEMWVNELARLKEKIKKVRKPLSSKDRSDKEEEVEDGKIKAKEDSKSAHVHGEMSEYTIFLLMDRFAPL